MKKNFYTIKSRIENGTCYYCVYNKGNNITVKEFTSETEAIKLRDRLRFM